MTKGQDVTGLLYEVKVVGSSKRDFKQSLRVLRFVLAQLLPFHSLTCFLPLASHGHTSRQITPKDM